MTEVENRYAVELPEGTVYVTIEQAEERDEHQGGRRVKVLYPMVELHTDPVKSWSKEGRTEGHVKIRGRKYRIWTSHRRVPDGWGNQRRNGSKTDFVETHGGYSQHGYFNDLDGKVGWDTQARKALDDVQDRALVAFDRQQPGWRKVSLRLALEYKVRREQGEISEAEQRIKRAEAEIAALIAKIAAL